MKLVFNGIVEDAENESRVLTTANEGSIYIGDRDVVSEIYDASFRKKIIVGIADETFTGDIFSHTGWGYSEYTPMEEDELRVGKHDLLEILRRYEGQNITLFISDEPINILEEVFNEA